MAPYVRADVRRAQLLSAAQEALVRAGLDRLTLRAVADEAGVRLSTLQYVFSSRADLIQALAEHVVEAPDRPSIVVGSAGLETELRRVLDVYAAEVLPNRAYVELVRSELVAGANATLSDEEIHYPAGRSILRDLLEDRVQQACSQSDETYGVSTDELSRIWAMSMVGVLWSFLRDADAQAFLRDGNLLVDALVEYAQPQQARQQQAE